MFFYITIQLQMSDSLNKVCFKNLADELARGNLKRSTQLELGNRPAK